MRMVRTTKYNPDSERFRPALIVAGQSQEALMPKRRSTIERRGTGFYFTTCNPMPSSRCFGLILERVMHFDLVSLS